MITAFLEIFHARKWIAELLLLLAIVGGIWWFCNHLIAKGVAEQRAADQLELVALQKDADTKTQQLRDRATRAEVLHETEQTELASYRASDPLHGGLCKSAANQGRGNLPSAQPTNPGNAPPGAASADVQPVPEGDTSAGGQRETDIRHLLDLFAGRGDEVSGGLREWQGR